VLQSPRMLDKPESYFWREINFALERQNDFGPGFRFIIPVLLEAHPELPLSNLRDLHRIDLTAPDGVDALAQTIMDDWRKRRTIRGL
jgi:hypothetical protein